MSGHLFIVYFQLTFYSVSIIASGNKELYFTLILIEYKPTHHHNPWLPWNHIKTWPKHTLVSAMLDVISCCISPTNETNGDLTALLSLRYCAIEELVCSHWHKPSVQSSILQIYSDLVVRARYHSLRESFNSRSSLSYLIWRHIRHDCALFLL